MRLIIKLFATLLIAVPMAANAISLPAADIQHGAIQPSGGVDHVITQRDGKTLAQAIEQVRRQYDVQRIVNADTRRQGNREVHRIKFMTRDGTVKTVTVQGRRLDR